jgi:tRNA threonylcarbamoyladenosine biosynthesis protein TsaB
MNRSSVEERVLMRLTLALEASSRIYAVAAGDSDHPSAQRAARYRDPGFSGLGELAAQALAAAGATFSDIGTIAVDAGPGGLSSIRAAVAYANGLAFSLGVKVFPITSLELMAIAARETHPEPVLSLKRGHGGIYYAGLYADGEDAEMRCGPLSSIAPAIADGLEKICVAGDSVAELADLLPDVTLIDSGIANADVSILYRTARSTVARSERLVDTASAVNEGSRIFYEYAGCGQPPLP